jgi:predicted nucleotidyltransferase
VILQCVVGSRAFGLADEDSDIDRRGVYLPTADEHWSLEGVPPQIEFDASQEIYWELEKFLRLALKSNPNILESLYSPLIEKVTPMGRRLIDLRECFLSRLVYQTYSGYVVSQFRKMQADIRSHGVPKWKHVMHLIRLLLAGIVVLREARVPIQVGDARDRLLAIKRGEVAFEEVDRWRLELHQQLEQARELSTLPERPDYATVNQFLIDARHAATGNQLP